MHFLLWHIEKDALLYGWYAQSGDWYNKNRWKPVMCLKTLVYFKTFYYFI